MNKLLFLFAFILLASTPAFSQPEDIDPVCLDHLRVAANVCKRVFKEYESEDQEGMLNAFERFEDLRSQIVGECPIDIGLKLEDRYAYGYDTNCKRIFHKIELVYEENQDPDTPELEDADPEEDDIKLKNKVRIVNSCHATLSHFVASCVPR